MPQTQENKVAPIIDAVAPKTPENVAPPIISVVQSGSGTVSGINPSVAPQIEESINFGVINMESINFGVQPVDSPINFGVINMESINFGERVVGKNEILETAKRAYQWLDRPHKWAVEEAGNGIDELFRLGGYKESQYNAVWANVVHGTPKVIVEALAQTGADIATDPIALATMGYSKGYSLLMKTPAGKKLIKPFLSASADYFAGRIPAMMKHTPHKVKMAVAESMLALGEVADYVGKDAVGSGVIGASLAYLPKKIMGVAEKVVSNQATKVLKAGNYIVTKGVDALNSLNPNITRWTSYRYGLASIDAYLKVSRDASRTMRDATILAAKTGATLWDGLSKEAQILGVELLESGYYSAEDIVHATKVYPQMFAAMGIKDSPEFAKNINNARKLVDAGSTKMAKDLLAAGVIDEPVYDIIMNNRGKYLRQIRSLFNNKETRDKIASGEITLMEGIGLSEDIEKQLARVGFDEGRIQAFNSLPEKERIAIAFNMGLKYSGKPISMGLYMKSNSLKKKKILSEAQKQVYGLETLGYRTAKTIEEQKRLIITAKRGKLISENDDWAIPTSKMRLGPTGWIKLHGKEYGYLNNHWVHPQIVNDLYKESQMSIDGEIGRYFMKKFRWALGLWKTSMVVLSPASHFVNRLGQAAINDLGGFDILEQHKYLKLARREMKTNGKLYKEAYKQNLFTSSRAEEELFHKINQPAEKMAHKQTRIGEGAREKLKIAGKKATEMFMNIDNEYKMARYLYEKDAMGASSSEALTTALKWNFDYERISPATRALRDNPIFTVPFFTFVAKSIPRVTESLLTNPQSFYKWYKLYGHFNANSLKVIGGNERDYEYLRKKRGVFLVFPVRTKSGKPVTMNIEPFFPFSDFINITNGAKLEESTYGKLQSGGPLKLAREAMEGHTGGKYGKDLFEKYEPQRVKLKKQFAHLYNGLFPPWAPTPDMALLPVQSFIDWSVGQAGVTLPKPVKRLTDKLTFESDSVAIGGRSFSGITNAVYHDLSDIMDDGDGVKHETIRNEFQKMFNPSVVEDFENETVVPQAIIYALLGLRIQPLDVNDLRIMDAAKVRALDVDGVLYRKFVMKLKDGKFTDKQRRLMIQNYRENASNVISEYRDAEAAGLVYDSEPMESQNEDVPNTTTP